MLLHLCQRPATAAPARPQRPCHPLGSSRCSLVCIRARRARVRGNGDSRRSSAAGAAHRAPTSSSSSALQNPLAGPPSARPVCLLARPFLPHRAPRRSPSGTAAAASTASCAMHYTPLTQDLKRQTTPAPPALHATLPRDMHTIGTREETSVGLRCALCAGAARTHSHPAASSHSLPHARRSCPALHCTSCTMPH